MDLSVEGINWLAVVGASVAAFLIGGVWYGALFSKQWVEGYGFTEEQVQAMKGKQARNFAVFLLAGLVIAAAMAVIAPKLGIDTWMEGLQLGGFIWGGFVATVLLVQHFAGNYKPVAFVIDATYQLLWFLSTGAIIAAWK